MNAIGGASGDMLLASLVDSGLDVMGLSSALTSVGIEGFQLEALLEDRQGVKGTHLDVNIEVGPGEKNSDRFYRYSQRSTDIGIL